MGLIKKKRCRNCSRLFKPDHRNKDRQNYCDEPECKQASKTASQGKWLNKPANRNYFSGPENVLRVKEWRKTNPGYWRKQSKPAQPLQDTCEAQTPENKCNNGHFTKIALQDAFAAQQAVIIGLIAQFTGTALQENIEVTLRQMQQLGQDVLSLNPNINGGYHYDCKVCDFTKPTAQSP